ncbi:MAG TPA: cytochrome P450 [Candidatus Dormibacteraeota bacterium]|nr:cytochrome P450 [Candidatus Dormibacteraeota bacterium]
MASDARSYELPPGPPFPPLLNVLLLHVQGVPWTLPYLAWCGRRWGAPGGGGFTLRGFATMVFVTDPKAGREAALGDIERVHAGEANGILHPLVGQSVITMDGPEMLERKRLVIEPLHNPDFLAFAAASIAEIAQEAVSRWPRGQVLALRRRMQEITLDVIIRLVFGAESPQEAADLRGRLLHLLDVCDPPFFLMLFWPEQYTGSGLFSRLGGPVVRWLARAGRGPWGEFLRARTAVDEAIYSLIRRREEDSRSAARNDILSLLVHNRRGVRLNRVQLRNELMTFLLAGHETTASALAWFFDLLLHHPDALARVRRDLAGGDDRYLEAAIQETLRLRPPIGELGRMLVEPYTLHVGQGEAARCYRLPARARDGRRVMLMPSIWLIQHDAASYADPERFQPERFLDQRPDPLVWLAFGGGQRQCLGYRFAPFEIREVVRAVLGAVDLRAASPRLERVVVRRITLEPARGTRVVVTG